MNWLKNFYESLKPLWARAKYFVAFFIIGSLIIGGICYACQYPNVHLNLW